ncbi:MAG TPA: CDP-diacylglycerol--glycerol-3-phosphate 3-phosphatidyltransferase [Holophagaceae bacterium]|jgi:cardiolipin synthase|nr:CDP-diacylglycerol--glycerol-3-phosphate 3-phosphatidyltransferase [Holophagaceae bacterium]
MTLPNALTLLRILAIPFFAIAVWYGYLWEALAIFIGAGITDLLDGWIARTFNQKSRLGAFLDPAADKLLMTTAFILMALPKGHLNQPIPAWAAIIAISRDVLISFVVTLALVRADGTDLRPSVLGKLTTGAELVAIGFGLMVNALGPQPWQRFFLPWIYVAMSAFILASGIHYFHRASRSGEPA